MIFSLVLILLVSVIFFYYKFVFNPHRVLKRNGIKGPTPSFFYGNHKEKKDVGLMKYIEGLHKTYGPIAGYYTGTFPHVSVTDVELIKLVTIKDSGNFINRDKIPSLVRRNTSIKPGLLQARDEAWRTARHALSPTFSASKMRAMTPLIVDSVRTLVEVFTSHAETGRSVELFRVYGNYTMETIFATAFGRKLNLQKGESDYLAEAAFQIFVSTHEIKNTSIDDAILIISNFPWLSPVLGYMMKGSKRLKSYMLLGETASKLIQERHKEKEPGKYKDFLQLMINASVEDSNGSNNKKMDDEDIAGHSITFLLAGYETTANALTYVSYLLALNPDIQEKLQDEIDDYFNNNPDASPYKASIDLDYLDMVIHESLRLYPPVPRFIRECAKDYCYKDIVIPAGAGVIIPCFLMQKDPNYWNDPDKFDPLRFTVEEKAKRPQQCYMPFGAGPRSCIGMRFALLETKAALIELMKKFSFVKTDKTEVPLETVLGVTMAPKNGMYLKIVIRE